MNRGPDVTDFLRSLPAQPDLLGLGEPTHGVEEFPRVRNEIFRHLVEHEGYRSITLESDCLLALTVDDYIATGEGTLDDVMSKGFSHGFGAYAANRELVAWMRDYNTGKPAADRLRFYGFDAPLEISSAPSPGPALIAAHRYLAASLGPELLPSEAGSTNQLVGDEARWSNPESGLDPAKSVGASDDANRLRIIGDDLATLFLTHSPFLIQATSRAAWWRAYLNARSAVGLLRYHALLASPGPRRLERGAALRDTLMADNLLAIREFEARRGPTLAFAGNLHLQRNKAVMPLAESWHAFAGGDRLEWWSAAAVAATRLGPARYAFLASDYGEGEPPLRGLHTSAQLAALPGLRSNVSDDFRYIPLDRTRLDGLDGVLFFEPVRDS